MIRILGILSVVLFWIVTLVLSPVILLLGVLVFLLSIFFALSSLVYDIVTSYLRKKIQ